MKEVNITELGDPNAIIKKDIFKTTEQRTNLIRPILEDIFNTSEIHLTLQDADSIPFSLYTIDFSLNGNGRIRYSITEDHLDTLLCLHLNIKKEEKQSKTITESHQSFFSKLCTRTLKYLDEQLTDYNLIEGGYPEYNINFKYELTVNMSTIDVFVSIDHVLAQNLSNKKLNNTKFSHSELKSFISTVPTDLDIILMKRAVNIKQLNNLKKGDFISLNNLESVELKINKIELMTAKLVISDTSQMGVCYE